MKTYTPEEIIGMKFKHPSLDFIFEPKSERSCKRDLYEDAEGKWAMVDKDLKSMSKETWIIID